MTLSTLLFNPTTALRFVAAVLLLAICVLVGLALLVRYLALPARVRVLRTFWQRLVYDTHGGMPVVRAFPIFINGKKVGQAHGTVFTITPNRQKVYGAEGFLSLTRGAVTCGVEVDIVYPVGGVDVKVLTLMIQQKDVTVQLPIGPDTFAIDMGFTGGNVTANTENGTVMGKFTLEGGNPKIV